MNFKQAAALVGFTVIAALGVSAAGTPPASLTGTWKGVYYTYPNLMSVELSLHGSDDGAVSGVLKFSPAVVQPHAFGAPQQGSYQVSGHYDQASRSFLLRPGAWIEKAAMPGLTAPLAGVVDVTTNQLAGKFEFPYAPTAVFFVLAPEAESEAFIAGLKLSAYPPPPTVEQQAQTEAKKRRETEQSIMQSMAGVPGREEAMRKMQLRREAGEEHRRQELEQVIARMKAMPPSPAFDRQIERMQAQLEASKRQSELAANGGAAGDNAATGGWVPPPADRLAEWAARVKEEYPKLDLGNTPMEKIYAPSLNLFEDDYFQHTFGITYEKMDVVQRKAVVAVFTHNARELAPYSYLSRPFQNVGDFGAPDVTVFIYWQRVVRAWLGDQQSAFTTMPAEMDSFAHLTAAEAAGKVALPYLWPAEYEKFTAALAESRTRLAGPVLALQADQMIARARGLAGASELQTWSTRQKDLLRYASAADRQNIQQRIDARIGAILDELMAGELRQVQDLGSGLHAVEAGSAWYARFTRDYGTFLRQPACGRVLGTFKGRRPADFASVAEAMIAQIRTGYDRLAWDDSAEAEQGRMQFAAELAGRLGAWFAVPGDNETATAKQVYAVAGEAGAKVKDLLPPSKRAELHFASTAAGSGHPPGTARERSPVGTNLLATADHADDATIRRLLPPPIADAGFDFDTDVCWSIFHGRFDDIAHATTGTPGFGSRLSAAVGNTNPQFHYAFISFVGISSARCGDKQIGPTTTVFWTTTTVHPDGTSEVDNTEKNPVKIPLVLADFYEASYNIAHAAADADGLFGTNPLGYLQTAAKLMHNGLLSQAGARADGSFSIAQADWERPILSDINELFTAWPPQSYGIWQFQENLKRYLKGQPSLQALWAQAREENGWTELHVAARRNDAALVAKLVHNGARPDVKDRYGYTPLHLAATDGSLAAMAALRQAGADVNARTTSGETPLSCAVTFDATEAITWLLAARAKPDLGAASGVTPLQEAAAYGYADAVELLLAAGASPTLRDETGMNVLDRAVASDDAAVLHVLLGHAGVNLQAKNKEGWTALHMAAKANSKGAIGELIAKGLDVNGKTAQGYTPLHVAAMNGATGAIDALIIRGADLQVRDAAGKTALDEAIASNNEPVILALRRQGPGSH
jgi:ankyrin repeat protein